MAEFDQLRDQLRQTQQQRDAAATAAAAQERQKRLAAQQMQLARMFHPNDERHLAERDRLQREQAQLAAEGERQRQAHAAALAVEAGLLQALAEFTDPRQGIERWKDSVPILLMPVRLETRFKTQTIRGRPSVPQLWLRIYPDDCWIDSFDPALTETKVRNATGYWASIWQAGGFEAQERGAWAALVSSHGSGRAAWIVQQFQPLNLSTKPVKPRSQDVILAIPSQAPLTAVEEAAIRAFWRALWLVDGDATQSAAARAALETSVSAARAAELVAQYVPVNFKAPLAPGLRKDELNVSVAIVVLPPIETKQNAWAHAPKATILPDRFVFLGYESENDTTPVVQIGRPVPSVLQLGPDPSAPEADQLQHDANGNLVVPSELQWISDFDRAIEVGMGLRIDLTPTQAERGFQRVLVIGLRLTADEEAAKLELETLLRHHAFSGSGIALVPQGTPTNNTEAVGAGHGRLDDPDASFDDLQAPTFTANSGWLDKRDGQWVAEYLGIDPTLFLHTHAAGTTDQRSARAMNMALWPATLGYWMETMMSPVFSREAIEWTREFFNRYVLAGGACPAIRIGWQPYGILPATTLSRMAWINQRFELPGMVFGEDGILAYLRRLYPILLDIAQDFRAIEPQLSFVGKAGDPHVLLLDIVGLHPLTAHRAAVEHLLVTLAKRC
jgi:hypothetical protein